jgi:hypothetical protein
MKRALVNSVTDAVLTFEDFRLQNRNVERQWSQLGAAQR